LIDELNNDGSSQTFDKKHFQVMCYLYKNFNKKANINELEIHRSSMHWLSDAFGIFHTFVCRRVLVVAGEKHKVHRHAEITEPIPSRQPVDKKRSNELETHQWKTN
jgi:hypothetical protein